MIKDLPSMQLEDCIRSCRRDICSIFNELRQRNGKNLKVQICIVLSKFIKRNQACSSILTVS